jgi:integrase
MGTVRFNAQRRAWMIDYTDAAGRRIRQTIGGGDGGKRLARKVLAQREAEVRVGVHRLPANRTPTFAEFAAEWLERQRARGLRPKTLEAYEDALDHHLLPTFGALRLGAITRRDVDAYLVARVAVRRPRRRGTKKDETPEAVPFAAATINKSLVVLKAMLRDAVEQGHLTENPAAKVRAIREPDREETLHVLQPDEIARLLDAAEDPWRTLYAVAVQTGLRRGELLALRWSDLDLRKGLVYVRRSLARVREGDGYAVREVPLKTRHSRRTVDLSPATVERLLTHPAGDDPERDFVFRSRAGGPIDPENVARALRRHLTAAGLPAVRFHDLRHTHASLLIAAGVHPKAMQARLGHGSITTTLNIYGHLMPSAFQGVGAQLDALLMATIRQQAPNDDERESRPKAETRVLTASALVGEEGLEPPTSSV